MLQGRSFLFKFVYSEKATKFCEISTLLLSTVHTDKSKVEISQNFVAFSEYMNFNILISRDFLFKGHYLAKDEGFLKKVSSVKAPKLSSQKCYYAYHKMQPLHRIVLMSLNKGMFNSSGPWKWLKLILDAHTDMLSKNVQLIFR